MNGLGSASAAITEADAKGSKLSVAWNAELSVAGPLVSRTEIDRAVCHRTMS
jgi:hypothetical protein